MKVSQTVHAITDAIRASRPDLAPRHRVLLELLRLMPLYCGARRLDAWETAILAALPKVNDAADKDTSEMGRLLEETFEFGRCNLYASFDPARTSDAYASVSKLLQQSGIDRPKGIIFTGL